MDTLKINFGALEEVKLHLEAMGRELSNANPNIEYLKAAVIETLEYYHDALS